MTIVFDGLEDYVRSIIIYFNTEGYVESDYHNKQYESYDRKPDTSRKPTTLSISKGAKDKSDIFFDLENAHGTIYNDLCYG